ncbi:MAG: hypothetical protein C0475_01715 [Planctomyces sp.]|nr:hypothetical protein [Planctomyces sp.]MBA4040119.1 hypothetical protein [Planctomyces sp.]MBA4119633.1 hypothetical protein [Isosphaera sp.]
MLAGALLPACAPPQGPARTSTPQPGVFSENGPLGPNWLTEAGSRLNRSGLDGAATSDIQPIQRPARPAGIDARP